MTSVVGPKVERVSLRSWVGFAALCLGMFMAILDIQVVVTSLPVIQDALKIGADRMSWVQTTYLIAEVITIPLTGLLIRVFTVRWLFGFAVLVFTLASLGCALSYDFTSLIICRVFQGFAGGVLIPLVFSAIFLMFPPGNQQLIATGLGGVLAVLAPTLGPLIGGWITSHYSWHWLFLINILPGLLTMLVGVICLPVMQKHLRLLKDLDWLSVLMLAVGLSALLIALKEAPNRGWLDGWVIGLFLLFFATTVFVVRRPQPAISFSLLKNRNLAYGCVLSFLLGMSLYGSVYLLPLFLAFVQGMGPLDIGYVMLIGGAAQLISAPLIIFMDRKLNARWLSIMGFVIFAIGLAMSSHQVISESFDQMFWPQLVRGGCVALCILPPIRFALGYLPRLQVPDASGLFNLSRNLGGAIGIALLDTVIFTRTPDIAEQIKDMLQSDPARAASLLNMPVADLPAADDITALMSMMDVIQQAAMTGAINEGWLLMSATAVLAALVLLVMGPIRVPATYSKDTHGTSL